jgi:hypothetical protein
MQELQTSFAYLCGDLDYCLKISESHFQFVERNVNVDEKHACKLEHAKHGVVVSKNHVPLSHNIVIEHVRMHGKIEIVKKS